MLFSDEQEILNQVLYKRQNIDNIKHDDVNRAISELQNNKDIYYSNIYRVNDCINLLQHYDDLLTVIRKEDVK